MSGFSLIIENAIVVTVNANGRVTEKGGLTVKDRRIADVLDRAVLDVTEDRAARVVDARRVVSLLNPITHPTCSTDESNICRVFPAGKQVVRDGKLTQSILPGRALRCRPWRRRSPLPSSESHGDMHVRTRPACASRHGVRLASRRN